MEVAERSFVWLLEQPDGYERLIRALAPADYTTPHPALPWPSVEKLRGWLQAKPGRTGEEFVIEWFRQRDRALRLEKEDPFRYGFILEWWKDADELLRECRLLPIFGGNRSAKTEYTCRHGVKLMVERPERQVLFLHESEMSSIAVQQRAVHKYLPAEWKKVRKNAVANISYSVKNGFSDKKFVTPNGSVAWFGSYKQELGDYEGPEYDLIVADENLPLAWLKTLLIRLVTRKGKFLWPYTCINGMTPAIKEVATGARTLRSRPVDADLLDATKRHVEDCPVGHMPYIQRAAYPDTSIIYAHSVLNPFANFAELKKVLMGMDVTARERRAYGYARNVIRAVFPKFGEANIIDVEKVPKNVTRYQYADPAGARNMFMIWVAVDPYGRHYVYREWPNLDRYGAWAEPAEDDKHWDGMAGPAQNNLGYGVTDYKQLIWELEGNKWGVAPNASAPGWQWCGEVVETRKMDPRSGKAQTVAEHSGGASLMDRFLELQVDRSGNEIGPPMDFLPAPGLHENEGFQAINDLLAWNDREPLTPLLNEPKLYVTRNCGNVIWALRNYTGHDGAKAACKDPIDLLRYMATDGPTWLDPKRARSSGGGSY
jgi:hypothetical protein